MFLIDEFSKSTFSSGPGCDATLDMYYNKGPGNGFGDGTGDSWGICGDGLGDGDGYGDGDAWGDGGGSSADGKFEGY